jgi:hypothetical protein
MPSTKATRNWAFGIDVLEIVVPRSELKAQLVGGRCVRLPDGVTITSLTLSDSRRYHRLRAAADRGSLMIERASTDLWTKALYGLGLSRSVRA